MNLSYKGAIRTPLGAFHYAGHPFTFDAARQEFVFHDFQRQQRVGRLKVVEPRMPTTRGENNGHALLDRDSVNEAPFVDPTTYDLVQGNWDGFHEAPTEDRRVGSLLVVGDRILVGGTVYYDANNGQRRSFFSATWPVPTNRTPWRQVGPSNMQGWVAGPACRIPERFRESFHFCDVISGQSGLPIISRQSVGPCAIAWKARDLEAMTTVPTVMLVGYPLDHPVAEKEWGGPANDIFNSSSTVTGMAFIGDNLVFFGTHGYGPGCYGKGTNDPSLVGTVDPADGGHFCFDPVGDAKGTHCYPYRLQAWVYPVADLIKVANGERQSWELVPTWFPISVPMFGHEIYQTPRGAILKPDAVGVGFDEQANRIYIALFGQDGYGYEPGPIVHVFDVSDVPVPDEPPPPPPPPPPPVPDLQAQVNELTRVLDETVRECTTVRTQLSSTRAELAHAQDDLEVVQAERDHAHRTIDELMAREGQVLARVPGREEMMNEGRFLHQYYASPEGLQREKGLSINDAPDWEGVGAWLFDVYLNARLHGKSPQDARQAYIDAIRQTDEWKRKHP